MIVSGLGYDFLFKSVISYCAPVARPFTGLKIVCANPNFLSQTKRRFAFSKFSFSVDTKHFGVALNVIQFYPAQSILGSIEGQGIRIF